MCFGTDDLSTTTNSAPFYNPNLPANQQPVTASGAYPSGVSTTGSGASNLASALQGQNSNQPSPYGQWVRTPNGDVQLATANGSYDFNFGGSKFHLQNPGSVDLLTANPALYQELLHTQGVRSNYEQIANQYLDQNRYDTMRNEATNRTDTRLLNQYAAMGLGGSSAMMGAVGENNRQIDMQYNNQRLSDALQALQGEGSLDSQIWSQISGIQQGYKDFQDEDLSMALGFENAKNQEQQNNNAIWEGLIKTVAVGAGYALGGPAGGAGAGMATSNMFQSTPGGYQYNAGSMVPSGYDSPNFGYIGDGPAPQSYSSSYGFGDSYRF